MSARAITYAAVVAGVLLAVMVYLAVSDTSWEIQISVTIVAIIVGVGAISLVNRMPSCLGEYERDHRFEKRLSVGVVVGVVVLVVGVELLRHLNVLS
jgi:tetrahydromethanopterin S-methyltransferase subunit C